MSIPEKPLAIIPARGGSKRFPRKNIAILAGKPLIAYAIEAARDSRIFDLVCVSSEDDEILEIAAEWGAQAVLKRPAELADDRTSLKEVCAYLLESFSLQGRKYQEFGLLLVTSPLRTSANLREAYLVKTDFTEADLTGADLTDAVIQRANFQETKGYSASGEAAPPEDKK